MISNDDLQALSGNPFLPAAGEQPGEYQGRVDAFRRQQDDEEARIQQRAAEIAAAEAAKAEHARASAIKSVAGEEESNVKSYLAKGNAYAQGTNELTGRQTEIEQQWTDDEKKSKPNSWFPNLFPGDKAAADRIEQHKKDYLATQDEAKTWEDAKAKLEADTRQLTAKRDAIKDIEDSKNRSLVTENPGDFGTSLGNLIPKRLDQKNPQDYRDSYTGELDRQGYPLTKPEKATDQTQPGQQQPASGPEQAAVTTQPGQQSTMAGKQAADASAKSILEQDVIAGRMAIQAEDPRKQIDLNEWRTLTPDMKRAKVADLMAAKQAKLDAYDAQQSAENEQRKAVVDDAKGVTGYEAANGITLANFGKELGRRVKSVGSAAMQGFASSSVTTTGLDLFNAGAVALGASPGSTWAAKQTALVRDFWQKGIAPEDQDAVATKLVESTAFLGGLAAQTAVLAPAVATLGLSTTVANIASKVPLLGRGIEALPAAEKAVRGAHILINTALMTTQQASTTFTSSIQEGMTTQQAFERAAVAGGLGAVQGLGVSNVLTGVNALTRGAVSKLLTGLSASALDMGGVMAIQTAGNELADLLILDKNDPRRKPLGQIATDSMESGAWGAATGLLFSMLMAYPVRIGMKKQAEQQGKFLDQHDAATQGMTAQAAYTRTADALNADHPVIESANARISEIDATLAKEDHPAEDATTTDANGQETRIPGKTSLEAEKEQLKKVIADNSVNADIVGIASDIDGTTSQSFDENEAKIAELKTQLDALTPKNQSFWNPTDYEKVAETQQELGIRLERRRTLTGEHFTDETNRTNIAKNLAIAKEIARTPAGPADKNGNGVPQGNDQRQIRLAILNLARTGSLRPGDEHLIGANGKRIFSKAKKGEPIFIDNSETEAALKATPLLNTNYETYKQNPTAVLQRVRETAAVQMPAGQEGGSVQAENQGQQAETPAGAAAGSSSGPVQAEQVHPAEPGRYRVAASKTNGRSFAKESIEVIANSPEEAVQKVVDADPSIFEIPTNPKKIPNPRGGEWMVREVLQQPKEAVYAAPEAAAPQEPAKPMTPEQEASVGPVVAEGRDRIAAAIAEIDRKLATETGPNTIAELQAKKVRLQAMADKAPEIVQKAKDATESLVRYLLPVFKGGARYILDPEGQDGGMYYDPATGQLVINAANLDVKNKDRIQALAGEEMAHAAAKAAIPDKDIVAMWRGITDANTREALFSAYESLRFAGSDLQRGHEFLRLFIQRKIGFTPEGKMMWDEGGTFKVSEEATADTTLIAKVRAALKHITDYISSVLSGVRDPESSKIIQKYQDSVKHAIEELNRIHPEEESKAPEKPAEEPAKEPAPKAKQPEEQPESAPEAKTPEPAPQEPKAPQGLAPEPPKRKPEEILRDIRKMGGVAAKDAERALGFAETAQSAAELQELLDGTHEFSGVKKGGSKPIDPKFYPLMAEYLDAQGRTGAADYIHQKAAEAGMREDLEAHKQEEANKKYDLLEAIKIEGGFPKVSREHQGQLDRLQDEGDKQHAERIKGVFQDNAHDIDKLRGNLKDYGFNFDTESELLDAMEKRLSSDEPIPGGEPVDDPLRSQKASMSDNEMQRIMDAEWLKNNKPNPFMSQKSEPATTAPAFFSKLEQVVGQRMQPTMQAAQVKGMVQKTENGIRPEEIKWSGIIPAIDKLADAKGRVTKDAVLEYLRNEGRVQILEVNLGGAAKTWTQADIDRLEKEAQRTKNWTEYERAVLEFNDQQLGSDANNTGNQTKFADKQVPGGRNYRERVLAMPADFSASQAKVDELTERMKALMDGSVELFNKSDTDPEAKAEYARRTQEYINLTMIRDGLVDEAQSGETGEVYRSGHFPDVPNYIAHSRENEREDSDGNTGILLETIQSDRHQAAKDQGYAGAPEAMPSKLAADIERAAGRKPQQVSPVDLR